MPGIVINVCKSTISAFSIYTRHVNISLHYRKTEATKHLKVCTVYSNVWDVDELTCIYVVLVVKETVASDVMFFNCKKRWREEFIVM